MFFNHRMPGPPDSDKDSVKGNAAPGKDVPPQTHTTLFDRMATTLERILAHGDKVIADLSKVGIHPRPEDTAQMDEVRALLKEVNDYQIKRYIKINCIAGLGLSTDEAKEEAEASLRSSLVAELDATLARLKSTFGKFSTGGLVEQKDGQGTRPRNEPFGYSQFCSAYKELADTYRQPSKSANLEAGINDERKKRGWYDRNGAELSIGDEVMWQPPKSDGKSGPWRIEHIHGLTQPVLVTLRNVAGGVTTFNTHLTDCVKVVPQKGDAEDVSIYWVNIYRVGSGEDIRSGGIMFESRDRVRSTAPDDYSHIGTFPIAIPKSALKKGGE